MAVAWEKPAKIFDASHCGSQLSHLDPSTISVDQAPAPNGTHFENSCWTCPGLARYLRRMMEVLHHCQIVKGARMSDQNPLSQQEFASAVEMLRELVPVEELNRIQLSGPATIYLWKTKRCIW